VINDNYDAFREARRTYIAKGRNFRNFRMALGNLDPTRNRLSNQLEAKFTSKFLTPIQQERLRVARDYAQELKTTLTLWWREAQRDER